jgi:hypothetical protein
MRSKRRSSDSEALIDSLTAAAIDRDVMEARGIVGALARGSDPAALVREAKACDRRLRSVQNLRNRLGLAPVGPSAGHALAV